MTWVWKCLHLDATVKYVISSGKIQIIPQLIHKYSAFHMHFTDLDCVHFNRSNDLWINEYQHQNHNGGGLRHYV